MHFTGARVKSVNGTGPARAGGTMELPEQIETP